MKAVSDSSHVAVERIARFVKSVTAFAGVDQAPTQRVDLGACIDAVLEMAAPSLPQGLSVQLRREDVPKVLTHPARVNQALMAVLFRAIDCTPPDGTLTIALAKDGDDVVVRIQDQGPELRDEQLKQLFDVGFDSAGSRVTLELGLPTVATTMHALGGSAEASRGDRGTTVTLRFVATAELASSTS